MLEPAPATKAPPGLRGAGIRAAPSRVAIRTETSTCDRWRYRTTRSPCGARARRWICASRLLSGPPGGCCPSSDYGRRRIRPQRGGTSKACGSSRAPRGWSCWEGQFNAIGVALEQRWLCAVRLPAGGLCGWGIGLHVLSSRTARRHAVVDMHGRPSVRNLEVLGSMIFCP